MRSVTHELVGASAAVAAVELVGGGPAELVVGATAALWGARLPDADRFGTRIHRRSSWERRSWIVATVGAVARVPLVLAALTLRHRGVSHSAVACSAMLAGAATVVALGLPAVVVAAGGGLALSYVAHVAADACTRSGVRFWAPFAHRSVWFVPPGARICTGSGAELAVAATAIAFAGLALSLGGL